MPGFVIKGVRSDGTEGSWHIAAEDEGQALEKAKGEGIYPTEVKEYIEKPAKAITPKPSSPSKKKGGALLLLGFVLLILSFFEMQNNWKVLRDNRDLERSLSILNSSAKSIKDNDRVSNSSLLSDLMALTTEKQRRESNPPHFIPMGVCIFIGASGVGFLLLGILLRNGVKITVDN